MNTIKEFIIDTTNSNKYEAITNYFKPHFPEMKQYVLKLYGQTGIIDSVISALVYMNTNNIMFKDDIEYFANVLDVKFHVLLVVNLMYELSSACTTICTRVNGENMMFRTMDWDLPFLKKITYKLKTQSYEAITWFGCVGYFTAQNTEYSIAINYRRTQNIGLIALLQNAIKTINLDYPASYLVRHIFESKHNTKNAYELLKSTKLISPVYFTFCPFRYNPQIIVRSPNDYKLIKRENGYVSQTNIDNDNSGDNIMWSIERKELIKKIMSEQKFESVADLLKINDYPIINHETIYVCVVSQKKGIVGKLV